MNTKNDTDQLFYSNTTTTTTTTLTESIQSDQYVHILCELNLFLFGDGGGVGWGGGEYVRIFLGGRGWGTGATTVATGASHRGNHKLLCTKYNA